MTVADDGGADGEERTPRIGSCVRQVRLRMVNARGLRAPVLCAVVGALLKQWCAGVSHVRTLFDYLGPGSAAAGFRLSGRAGFPAPLQCCADSAGADRAVC